MGFMQVLPSQFHASSAALCEREDGAIAVGTQESRNFQCVMGGKSCKRQVAYGRLL
ncbi:hypothetical protein SAMN06265222_11411 [Neorhodopirellula lusitana]|uniref:Uncharacterized protein n=1 Tax=Neorhodopirellula lusitana TaxID=445327 RepID=A0ABY1QHQ8_9BACT|nr:hypothetical protein SAMN06265222_11411 [Neorhodopirellula lusitana]